MYIVGLGTCQRITWSCCFASELMIRLEGQVSSGPPHSAQRIPFFKARDCEEPNQRGVR